MMSWSAWHAVFMFFFVVEIDSARRVESLELGDERSLLERWDDLMQVNGANAFESAAKAAEQASMPTKTLEPKVLKDGKTRNSYRRSGAWLVKWRNEHRKAAADLGNLWAHRWDGKPHKKVAHNFSGAEDFATKCLARFGENGEVRFTWVLSTDRLIVGIAEDVLEIGVAHLNLVRSTTEKVYIAGEGCFNCAFYPGQFVINFLSGTFSIPIMLSTDPIWYQRQWVPLVKELWKFNGEPAEVKSVDYSQGMDVHSEALQRSIKRAEILRDDGRRNPCAKTKKAFCKPSRASLKWMKYCVCKRTTEGNYVSWCNKKVSCHLEKCKTVPHEDLLRKD